MKNRIIVAVLILLTATYWGRVQAKETVMPYRADQIVDAIYKAEGGNAATYLYGIRSIPYKTPLEARRICLNTVNNQWKRHTAHTCGKSFMQCLADRYCPVGCGNDTGTNQFWLKNVMYFLTK